ncbi:PilN domain-containing protein [Bacillus sp. PS06]|uniref:PilN domain-containing protein n=1 Tax=Bacillus sp. PS06 TaxID=2764176 RepID=UPI0017821ABA|nr:hypothetical protein [Bacillus sp. PS06]MBD8068847.1 hypothetical protein [Bacillus sp. PS06]
MLVEINLLPKKQIKNRAGFVVFITILVLALLCTVFVITEQSRMNTEKQRLSSTLSGLEAERIALEQAITQGNDSNSVIKLDQTVKWADEYFVEAVPLIQHLSSLLPARGFIQSFNYTGEGNVSYIVQFDTNTEVANYLAALKESPYLTESRVNSITSSQPAGETSEETDTDEVILPRYLAQFELVINKEELKQLQKEGN